MAKSVSTKASFKQSFEDFGVIMKSLRNKQFKGVYLLMGEESYFIDRISEAIASMVLSEEERAFNQTILYGRETQIGDLIDLCRGYPMMASYNVIILKEAAQLKGIEELTLYLKAPQPSTILVICYKDGSLDKRGSLYKKIKDSGLIFESIPPRDYEIASWIKELYRNRGRQIEEKALSMLTEHLGTSLSRIVSETDKMLINLGETVNNITADHIELNIGISKEYNIFELNKALSERNLSQALNIADHFAQNPKDNPFVVTISMLFTHFLRIFSLGIIGWNTKKKGIAMPSDVEIAKEIKLPNPYFVKEYTLAVRNYPTSKSFIILSLLREYDMKSKGVDGGSASDSELLKELIFKIFAL